MDVKVLLLETECCRYLVSRLKSRLLFFFFEDGGGCIALLFRGCSLCEKTSSRINLVMVGD